MATTRSRSHGREHARPSSGGVAAEHATKIWSVAIVGIVVIIAFLALTGTGHVIDAATQHFMLYYAGVFALLALCTSVGFGLIATDRVFLNPGHRVLVQAGHRAASFGAVTFLIVHILTEILAQRSHVIDAVVPFLSPFRTFYIGLGTIASDLIILLVITGILRSRFTSHSGALRWRVTHYTSYAAFVFGVWHGLLGGRPGKPYVDWSYGLLVAAVAVAVAIRVLATSLRPKENLSSPTVPVSGNTASAPLRAAAAFAQAGNARAGRLVVSSTAQPVLSAPVGDYDTRSMTALPAVSEPGDGTAARQPYYEPGYEGPPRYLGAPAPGDGSQPRAATGPMPRAATGPMPRAATGPMPRAATGPMPRAATGPMPRPATGPMPRAGSGPMPRPGTGPMPRPATGPMPRPATGPMPRAATGAMPQAGNGPLPGPASGPMPRAATGPARQPMTGPLPQTGSGPSRNTMPGPVPRPATGPMPRTRSGPMAPPGADSMPPPGAAMPQGDGRGRNGPPRAARSGGVNQDQPPWDDGVPGVDPAFMYREPGPGMPGYRGSRDQRYGGDRR